MTDEAAAILVRVAVETNGQLKARVAQVDVANDPSGVEKILIALWRDFCRLNA